MGGRIRTSKNDPDDADLNGATLNGATLAGTYLKDADLFGMTPNSADLTGAIWKNTTCPDGTTSSGTSPRRKAGFFIACYH